MSQMRKYRFPCNAPTFFFLPFVSLSVQRVVGHDDDGE